MLHEQDTSMVIQNPSDPHTLYRLDLATGKVVDEWKISDDVTVSEFTPESKYAQMTAEQKFVGMSQNGIFRVDPRLSGKKLVDSQFKQYASKTDFSTLTTTEAGKIVVASNRGDIRLYDAVGKNARTAFPALGDPIIGVDASADGRYLIATCKTYLLFLDTKIPDGKYKGQLGCKSS